jgi:hypothetical protein
VDFLARLWERLDMGLAPDWARADSVGARNRELRT